MLQVKELTKVYNLNKNKEYKALQGIDLKFPDCGFIFLVGKSGSGKSTFLNIIGGLDRHTSGDVLINGKSLSNFNDKEIDAYRNTHVGFVFQEFNLLEEYDVFGNVDLALKLRNDKDLNEDKIKNILAQVELEDKIHNKINELSGGQKQRVSIARALVKNPDILFVDEPTGNLDSETGKKIMDLLKELSKTKLIIMVTHDLEYSEEYADRIITLKDGLVVSDNETNKLSYSDSEETSLIHSKLPVSSLINIALNSIKNKMLKISLTILLLTTTMFIFGFSETINRFEYSTAMESSFNNDENNIVKLVNGDDGDSKYIYPTNFNDNDYDEISEKFSEHTFVKSYSIAGMFELDLINSYKGDIYSTREVTRVVEVKSLDELDLVLMDGRFVEKDNEIVISEYIYDYLIKEENGLNNIGDILNKNLFDTELVVSGIYKSNHTKYSELSNYRNQQQDDFPMDLYSEWEQYKHLVQSFIIGEGQYKKLINYTNSFSMSRRSNTVEEDQFQEMILIEDEVNFTGMTVTYDVLKLGKYNDDYINDKNVFNKLIVDSSFNGLNDNEIILNLDFFRVFYNLTPNPNSVNLDYLKDNGILNSELTISYKYTKNDSVYTSEKNVKVVGVFQHKFGSDYFENDYTNNILLLNENDFSEFISIDLEVFAKLDNNSKEFFDYIKDNRILVKTAKEQVIYEFTQGYQEINNILLYISLSLGLFSVSLFFNNISLSIIDKKKEIGTLRAIGASGKDVSKIFIFEALIISLIISFIAIVALFGFTTFLNNSIVNIIGYKINIFNISFLIILEIIIISITIGFFSSIFPSWKISKMKPIDAIGKR